MKLLIIRPEPGASASAERARAAGFDPQLIPFFVIAPRQWQAPDPSSFDAVLVTSANAIRHAGPQLDRLRSKPFHAVGERSAAAIKAAGLTLALTGSSGIADLIAAAEAAGHRRLLWLAGEDRTDIAIPPSVALAICTVYAADPVQIDPAAVRTIASCPIAALHSARAATAFAQFVDASQMRRDRFLLAAFSPAIAAAAGTGWAGLATANAPNDTALLSAAHALVRQASGHHSKGIGI